MKIPNTVVHTLVFALAASVSTAVRAQEKSDAPPDFSGVYYPINPFGNAGRGAQPQGQRQGPPAKPTSSAPLADGSQGRAPNAPPLNAEYMAKWEKMRDAKIAGSSEYDNSAKCLPPGVPAMMSMAYGMEVMQTKDKITFFSELNDALRRVYLDGRSLPRRSWTIRRTRVIPRVIGKATLWWWIRLRYTPVPTSTDLRRTATR